MADSIPRRWATVLAAFVASMIAAPLSASARPSVVVFADHDDDDANGIPDDEQAIVPRSAELLRVNRPARAKGAAPIVVHGDAGVRVLADGKPVALGASIPEGARRIEVQGTRAGRGTIGLLGDVIDVSVVEIHARDGEGHEVDLARSHASLERTPPARLPDDAGADDGDPDAVRFVVIGPAADVPALLSLMSFAPDGRAIDALIDVPVFAAVCPAGTAASMTCGATRPIRAVADDVDRNHPLVAGRSIKAELGGAIGVASARGEKLQMLRVEGPRTSPAGPIGRFRAHLRVLLVRLSPHGPPPLGGDDAGAIAVARAEVAQAGALWGACGIGFGPVDQLDVRVVDPPRSPLVAVGCDLGLPASGGALRVRVDGHAVAVTIAPGTRPSSAARTLSSAIAAAGFTVEVSDNAVIAAGAFGSTDVLVRRRDGGLAVIEPPASGPVSTDATLTACIGRVDLEDGLQHFGDVDAVAGTVEERALIKALDDGDPSTIEVLLIPGFAGGGRIGESFLGGDGGAIGDVILVDRAGVRADRAAFALAHELGHVLLDEPGHPDDFGVDTPTRLMDGDAANASAFGPRRLTLGECARAIRQSGPGGPNPLLRGWPLSPLGATGGRR